jgi:small GTP-binding protein
MKLSADNDLLEHNADSPDYLLKILLVGDSGVGKTCVASRFTDNRFFTEMKPTIGIQFATKTVHFQQTVVKVQIWDTAGQERYRAMASGYYKGAVGAMIVYDITSSFSFRSVARWLAELRQQAEPRIPILLIGNKADSENQRSVSVDEAKDFAERNHLLLLETSAKDDTNVGEAFESMIDQIMARCAVEGYDQVIPSSDVTPGRPIRSQPHCC